ncbi:MAG: secondary thiamine-phosphate synthase enzyme YjbQ [bacterium]
MNIRRGAPTPPHGTSGGTLKVVTQTLDLATQGGGQMIDLTPDASRLLASAGLQEGQVTIFIPGSTASVTTIEFEPGLKKDFPNALEHVAPVDAEYEHDNTWHDGNGHSHVRAALVGPSLVVPFQKGRLLLGTWQQIVLVDWDNRARRREIVFQFIGQS